MPLAHTSETPQISPHFRTALVCHPPSLHFRSSAGAPISAANLKNVGQMLVSFSVKTFPLHPSVSAASSHPFEMTSRLPEPFAFPSIPRRNSQIHCSNVGQFQRWLNFAMQGTSFPTQRRRDAEIQPLNFLYTSIGKKSACLRGFLGARYITPSSSESCSL